MTEFSTRLLANIQTTYARKLARDKKLKRLAKQIANSGDYNIANDYAVRAGEILSESIQENTVNLPYMTRQTAEEVLTPMLTADYELITDATNTVQENMNAAAGIGLGVQTPALDTNRIAGLINKVASYSTMDEARWVLGEPLINYSQAIVDQSIRDNARVGSKAGGDPVIIRETEGMETRQIKRGKHVRTYTVPCKWCDALAGRYDYYEVSDTGNDVFRRHENCRCHVTYVYGNKRQNVWGPKKEWTEEQAQKQIIAVDKALERQNGAYYPSEMAGVEQGKPMTIEEADSGNVNPRFNESWGYRNNCQSCVVTYEARLRGYDVEVLPYKDGTTLARLSRNTELAWRNADGTPAQFLIGGREQWKEMMRTKQFFTPKTFEETLHNTLKPGERYNLSFAWRGRGNSGHIVTMDISEDNVLHIYDPQSNENYYGKQVTTYLKALKYKRTVYGDTWPSSINVMRVDDKLFDLDICDNIMKAK